MMTKFNKKEDGFTLIELLVVILIIGILSAIAIPAFLSQRSKAWEANAKSAARNAALIVETYKTGNGGTAPSGDVALKTRPSEGKVSEEAVVPSDLGSADAASEWKRLAPNPGSIQLSYKKGSNNDFVVCARDVRITASENTAIYKSTDGGLQQKLVTGASEC